MFLSENIFFRFVFAKVETSIVDLVDVDVTTTSEIKKDVSLN